MTESSESVREKYWMYHHRKGGTWPVILILLGIIFLLNNFGILPWTSWSYLWRLWPLFLIVPGIHMVFGKSPIAHFISILISLLLIVLVLALALSPTNPQINHYLNQYLPGLQEHISVPQDFNTRDFNQDPSPDDNTSLY
jgi:hypothetical protein